MIEEGRKLDDDDDHRSSPPLLLSASNFTTGRIWILRKWRSMPRLLQVYLVAAALILVVIISFLSITGNINGNIKYARGTSHRISQHQSHESELVQQDTSMNEPSQVVVDQPRPDLTEAESSRDPVFQFKSSDSYREISWSRDILNSGVELNADQKKVIAAMKYSWDAYRDHAWGADHLTPMNKGTQNWFHVGLTIIDSLDSLLLMGKEMKYAADEAIGWVENYLTFDIYKDVNCFEMTIRVLGGLLSSFHVTKNHNILLKAVDVGDRLLHCFDSATAVPYSDVNLKTKIPKTPAWAQESSLAEVSCMQLEFRDLTRVTGDDKFEKRSFNTNIHIHDLVKRRKDPLLPMFINPNTGQLAASTITLGARGDSYYEYLFKQWIQTSGDANSPYSSWLREDYLHAIDAIKERMWTETLGPNKYHYIAELLRGSNEINPKMDHLTCFMPGVLALGHYHHVRSTTIAGDGGHHGVQGGDTEEALVVDASSPRFSDHLDLAEDLARTCFNMYNMTKTGLSPEIVYFGLNEGEEEMYIKPADAHNLLRPEYIESLFYLFHITGKEKYREQGRQILYSFNHYCKVPSGGYTSIDDVRNPDRVRPRNMQESYWTGETLKYLFLLFSDDGALVGKILNHHVINTEAHLIPIRV